MPPAPANDPALLLARLQLAAPEARSFLFATADPSGSAGSVASGVAAALSGLGAPVAWTDCLSGGSSDPAPSGCQTALLDPELFLSMTKLRAALSPTVGYHVIAGDSLLHDARTLLLCAAVDAVVLVCRRGATSRAELERARAELDRLGTPLAGAVLLE